MFTGAPVPPNDIERIAALKEYRVLDTPPEFEYDALTEVAAQICGCPVAVLGLIDETRDWFKAKYGLPDTITEAARDMVICSATICQNDLMYVPDVNKDERFREYPDVVGKPYIRFYCGMPLINREGYALGSFCVIDFEPHEITPAQREAVRRLAHQAVAQLELRRHCSSATSYCATSIRRARRRKPRLRARKNCCERFFRPLSPPSSRQIARFSRGTTILLRSCLWISLASRASLRARSQQC
jgi:adenylate cyclase